MSNFVTIYVRLNLSEKLSKVKDLRSYFKQNEKKNDSIKSAPTSLSSALRNVPTTELPIVGEEIKKSYQSIHYNTNILDSIKLEVGDYAKVY